MRFWQKVYLFSVILFIIAFDIGAYLLISFSYDYLVKSEDENGIREQAIIASSILTNIDNLNKALNKKSSDNKLLATTIKPLADYYIKQGVYLSLHYGENEVFSNMPKLDTAELLTVSGNTLKLSQQKPADKRYLLISSQLGGYKDLRFIYTRDITTVDTFRLDMSRMFAYVSATIILILLVAYYFLVKRLTKPIERLNATTAKIASGGYGERVTTSSRDELGELSSTFNLMADSIEEKIKELTAQSQSKQQFIDNLAHEMKTPMTSILGYSAYLQTALSSESDRIKAAGYIEQSARQLSGLSQKLLELTAFSQNKIPLYKLDPSPIFERMVTIITPIAEVKGVKLAVSNTLNAIVSDEFLLLSLLTNLAENAIKASSEGDTVLVKAYIAEHAVIEVADTGCGIDEEQIKLITEPFYRVDRSRSRESGGVGLGLSIARQIAELHDATIKITSKLGEGTTVRVSFYNTITS